MKKALLVLLTIAAFEASAQTPVQVMDIYPGATGSFPNRTTVFNNKLYFVASDATTGRELRVYDGVSNPSLVYDINPGNVSGFLNSANLKMAVLNGKLYFGATNGTTGRELMSYDGTNSPVTVSDFIPGAVGSDPYDLYSTGGKILYNGTDGVTGYELFVYDGVNTPVVFDINTGASSGNPDGFTSYNNKVYFGAANAAAGFELFVYDPSNNTVALAYDIESGSGSSNIGKFITHGGKLYFIAYTSTYGQELYSYDGTTATRLTDIAPGVVGGVSGGLAAYNNYIYFAGGTAALQHQLYRYDPSNNTSTLVYNIYPGANANISNFVVYGNKLYFNASTAAAGHELWVHDGTSTTLVADINTGVANGYPSDFEVYNGKLYFNATTVADGAELYSLTDPALGVQNVKLDGVVTVSPNPTTGNATVQLSLNSATSLNIQLTDISGKMIWNSNATNYNAGKTDITIPLAQQAVGMYFYRVTDNKGTMMASGKLTKE